MTQPQRSYRDGERLRKEEADWQGVMNETKHSERLAGTDQFPEPPPYTDPPPKAPGPQGERRERSYAVAATLFILTLFIVLLVVLVYFPALGT